MKSLKDIGEFGFIDSFSHKFESLLKDKEIGIGDDCAVFSKDKNTDILFTTDLLAEGIHFIREKISPFELGYKSVAVNLSDIAAMGGKCIGTFLSIAVPPSVSLEFLDEFMDGYLAISKEFDVPLMGGDTTKSLRDIAINVGVIGEIEKGRAKMRADAKVGDIVCVTGCLGDSAGGLNIIINNDMDSLKRLRKEDNNTEYLINKHYLPKPRLDAGMVLSEFAGVHAMMDISDGIGSDLRHILKNSNVGAEIDISKLPLSNQLMEYFGNKGMEYLREMAITGGEDYELLLTVNASDFEKISKTLAKKTGSELYAIGRITDNCNVGSICWKNEETVLKRDFGGFNHFSQQE